MRISTATYGRPNSKNAGGAWEVAFLFVSFLLPRVLKLVNLSPFFFIGAVVGMG